MVTRVDDAITAEIIRNGLWSCVEEASIVVVRSSHSTFIQEGADACAALLDAERPARGPVDGDEPHALGQPAVLAPRTCSPTTRLDVDGARVTCSRRTTRTAGGIHANDIVVFRPIFADGRVVFFAGTLIHVADVGGTSVAGLAALATDTFAEGLLLPPVRLYAADEPVARRPAHHRAQQPGARQGHRRRARRWSRASASSPAASTS